MEWTQRCTWRPWSSEFGDALWGHNQASLEMQFETEIECTQRCTGRLWSSEFGDAIGDRDWVNSEMHWEAVSKWGRPCTWSLRSSEHRDALRAVIEAVYRCTCSRLWSRAIRVLGVGWSRGGLWEAHQVLRLNSSVRYSKAWECDEVAISLKVVWWTSWWQSICREVWWMLRLQSGVNSKSRQWRDDRQSLVYAVLGVSCTLHMLHLVLTHDDGMER